MPENTVYVGRGTEWGNPFKVGDTVELTLFPEMVRMPLMKGSVYVLDREEAVYYYRVGLLGHNASMQFHRPRMPSLERIRDELEGKNLACWCPLDQPCHADVLLELANWEVPF